MFYRLEFVVGLFFPLEIPLANDEMTEVFLRKVGEIQKRIFP